MAEIVVSAVMTVLTEKLLSVDFMKLARSQGIDSQLEKWKNTLRMIHAVLADASKKQITNTAVELWLNNLHELAYDIDDVLDDLATEAMKRNFKESRASASTSSKVMKMIPTCCTSYTPHNIMYGRKMSPMVDKITTRLNDLFEQKNNFGLNVSSETSNRTNKRLEETSLLPDDVSEILGREGDKQALLGKLLGDEETSKQNVRIVSIVGMGGIGKTTLARRLYNDQKVKNHFKLMAWVCVSDEFDVFNISKNIYQAVAGEDKAFNSLELLHVALREALSKKRFLLVLDDVWNDDQRKWEALKKPFVVGAPGSKIVVTTRKTNVASVMNSVQPHNLGVLSDEYALSLFAKSALNEENFDKHPSLEPIARGIIKKCDGLPLALIALGRVLKNKKNDAWEELLNSEIWSSQHGSDILPALKLSYYDLPPHLKQLFAYCSLFPKNYEFKMNELVLLWMAEGFLYNRKSMESSNSKSMESLGRDYLEELQSRFFFQKKGNDETKYTMHDLMHDLAISVAGEFFFLLDDKKDSNDINERFEKLRHFSFCAEQGTIYKKVKELYKARSLRTFLPVVSIVWRWTRFISLDDVLVKLLTQLAFLRVLNLAHSSIEQVPQSIGSLKHLRYLNFSSTNIKQIPEEVSKLYNLQSLLVRDCNELSSLPLSLVKLINLRHLDMTNTPSLKKLPLGIGGLTSLQTLSKVIIEGGNGFKVSELKDLKDLQGGLYIEGLEKVIEPTEAKDANLQQKKGLDDLELVWSDVLDDSRDPTQANDANLQQKKGLEDLYMEWGTHHGNPTTEYEEVLERLRAPHNKLKKLRISGYGGTKFPKWVGDPSFDQLTEIVLIGCVNCRELPTLGDLTSLRKFEIDGRSKLESIKGEKEVVNVGSSIVRSLRQVKISYCHSLESYCCPNNVERLVIYNCDSMKSLSFSKLQEEELPSSSSSSSNLKILEVRDCKNIKSIGEKEVVNVGSSIMGSLRHVKIENCNSLESYCCPNSVERLEILGCDSMTSLSFSKLQEEDFRPSSSSSSNLKILEVRDCKNIKSIGEKHYKKIHEMRRGFLRRSCFVAKNNAKRQIRVTF